MFCSFSSRCRHAVAWLVLPLCVAFSGCGSETESQERQQSNIKPLGMMYGQFQGRHGRPPTDDAELKKFVEENRATLSTWGVSDPQTIFNSPRDNNPYVIRYGELRGEKTSTGTHVIAYEQEGAAGKRFVADTMGNVMEVDAEELKKYVPEAQ